MSLAEQYLHYLQEVSKGREHHTLQNPLSSASLSPALILTSQQLLTQLVTSTGEHHLEIIDSLKHQKKDTVRQAFEELFFTQEITLRTLSLLVQRCEQPEGRIETSEKLWSLLNRHLQEPEVLEILERLTLGKPQERIEVAKVCKFIRILSAEYFQPIAKVDLAEIIDTQHSRLQEKDVLRGIVAIVTRLSNKRIQLRTACLFINLLINKLKNHVRSIDPKLVCSLMEIAMEQQATENVEAIQTLLQHLLKEKLLSCVNFTSFFSLTDLTVPYFIRCLEQTKQVPEMSVLLELQKQSEATHSLYRRFLHYLDPLLYNSLSSQDSSALMNQVPLKYVRLSHQQLHLYLPSVDLKMSPVVASLHHIHSLQEYSDLINFEIKQLHKSSYTKPQGILDLIKHVNILLHLDQYSEVSPLLLHLVRELFDQRHFEFQSQEIYRKFGRGNQDQLAKHYSLCTSQVPEWEELYPHLLYILGNTSSVPMQEVVELMQRIEKFDHFQHRQAILRVYLNYHLPKSAFLNIDNIASLKKSDLLIDLVSRYQLPFTPSLQLLQTLEPSQGMLIHLRNYPDLLNQITHINWDYYKLETTLTFTEVYKEKALPCVLPVVFRGSLFLDKPLVLQYLTPRTEQLYFGNYSTYMSLLYTDILMESSPDAKEVIPYLLERVRSVNKSTAELNGEYYTNLVWWKLFVLACYKCMTPSDTQLINTIMEFLLKDIENKNLPILRQYMELLFSRLLCLDSKLVTPLLNKLSQESTVNVNAPVVLALGLHMLQHRDEHIFQTLLSYISSHTAYVRALCQFYCFEYLKASQSYQVFLESLLRFSESNKDSKKLMRNIRIGIDNFTLVVRNMTLCNLMTANFEKCENDIIDSNTFQQLESGGFRFLKDILHQAHPQLKSVIQARIQGKEMGLLVEPSFSQYLDLYHRPSELIIVATLLEKMPNFGHLVRSCALYPSITLVFPSKNILNEAEYKELAPEELKCHIVQVKEKDTRKYLAVQKSRGYQLVALEQTSNSVTIDKFQFPQRVVIVLGNERVGMNSNIIDLMDHLVEIQQFGKVRSLNVHVSSVILLWSYHQGMLR